MLHQSRQNEADDCRDAGFSAEALIFVNHLRLLALKCRADARADLSQACAVLSSDPRLARDAYAETLIRCFSEGVGVRAKLHPPGSRELSFDEAWLARLSDSLQKGDEESFRFLIQSRVPKHTQRNLAFLVRASSETALSA